MSGGLAKAWKLQRRPQRSPLMFVGGEREAPRSFEIVQQGVFIGRVDTVALYFEGNRRFAVLRKSGNDELDALYGRLLRAFYNIEVRT